MFFHSQEFKALEAGTQLTWMQQQLHVQNISNSSTPGYKTKSLAFDTVLNAEKVKNGSSKIHAKVVENKDTSVLQDGNNVDFEKENIELYKSYVQYSALLNKIKGQFDNYNVVLNSNMK